MMKRVNNESEVKEGTKLNQGIKLENHERFFDLLSGSKDRFMNRYSSSKKGRTNFIIQKVGDGCLFSTS